MYSILAACLLIVTSATVINLNPTREDFCAQQPCGEGNTCFNTQTGYKCFCRPGDDRYACTQEEKCLLYNHTGVCRANCLPDETGFVIQHLGGQFMDLKIYNKDGNVTVKKGVPVVDIKEQEPCMWQLTGNPDCCVPTEDVNIGCFAFGSYVTLDTGKKVPIETVKTGDRVLSMSLDKKEKVFSDVIMIMHQEAEREEEMVIIEMANSKLTLTHDHLVYVRPVGSSEWMFRFAELVKPMDKVVVISDEEGSHVETILTVSWSLKKGLYAPVTTTGTIVVDGITASCYGNHPDHWLAHMVFAPIRFLYKWLPFSYDGNAVTKDGSHPYVAFLNVYLRKLTGKSLDMSIHRLDKLTAFQ